MTNLSLRIRERAECDPQAPFATWIRGDSVDRVTFGALYAASRVFATALIERGVGPGDIVPILLKSGRETATAFVGTLLSGATPTFMPPPSAKQPPDIYWRDLAALFVRLRPRMVISYAENIAASQAVLSGASIEMLSVDEVAFAGPLLPEETLAGLRAQPSDVACLQHSSGTTGLKKGVMLSHRAILHHVAAYSRALRLTRSDSIVSWLPLYHDMGFVACFLTALTEGTPLVLMDPFEWSMRPHMLLDAIGTYRPTLCWLPNFAFTHLVNTAKRSVAYDLSSIRAFINCSEPCKAETFERFLARFGSEGADATRLGVCYAMAENIFAVSQTPVNRAPTVLKVDAAAYAEGRIVPATSDPSKRLLSCGPPVESVRVRVIDAAGEEAPSGLIGELHLSSAFLFSGYYLQPDVTERKLSAGWYSTGDMGFVHDGEIYVTGRVDDMLIVNGRNFYAHEIEAIVNDAEGVIPGRCVAIGIDDERSDATAVVVLAEVRANASLGDGLQRRIKGEVLDRLGLALHACVEMPPGSLIKTTSGKISRVENKLRYMETVLAGKVG